MSYPDRSHPTVAEIDAAAANAPPMRAMRSVGYETGCTCRFALANYNRLRRIQVMGCSRHPDSASVVIDDSQTGGSESGSYARAFRSTPSYDSRPAPAQVLNPEEYHRQILEGLRAVQKGVTELCVAFQRFANAEVHVRGANTLSGEDMAETVGRS